MNTKVLCKTPRFDFKPSAQLVFVTESITALNIFVAGPCWELKVFVRRRLRVVGPAMAGLDHGEAQAAAIVAGLRG